jgi:hydrogenase/urease accessory protein HupE
MLSFILGFVITLAALAAFLVVLGMCADSEQESARRRMPAAMNEGNMPRHR